MIRETRPFPNEMAKKMSANMIKGKAKLVFIFPIQLKRKGAIVAPRLQPMSTIALAVFNAVNGIFSGK